MLGMNVGELTKPFLELLTTMNDQLSKVITLLEEVSQKLDNQ